MRNSAIAMNQSATTHTYMLIGRLHFWTLKNAPGKNATPRSASNPPA